MIDLYPYKGMDYHGDLELPMPLAMQPYGPSGAYIHIRSHVLVYDLYIDM